MALYFIYYFINLLAVVSCFISWKNYKNPLRYQWVYLFLNLISEISAHFLKSEQISFLFIYNIFIPIEYAFFIVLLSVEIKNIIVKKISLQSVWIFSVIGFINLSFFEEYFIYNYLYLIRCVLFIVFISFYLYELYKSDEVILLAQIPTFWISIGFFVFCVSTLLIMGFNSLMSKIDFELANSLYQSIIVSLNILLYGTFIIASLCTKKKYNL